MRMMKVQIGIGDVVTIPAGAFRITEIGERSAHYTTREYKLGTTVVPDIIIVWPKGTDIGAFGKPTEEEWCSIEYDACCICMCKLEPSI